MASVGTIKYKNGSSWIDILHPINSFYISYASTSPSSLFGGVWTQVRNAVLRGATGIGYVGSDTHILIISEMPSHTHSMKLGHTSGNISDSTWPMYVDDERTVSKHLGLTSWNNPYNIHTSNILSSGGAAHSIVQRSFNCYIWYRIA